MAKRSKKRLSILPQPSAESTQWGQLYGSSMALAIAEHAYRNPSLTLVITPNSASMQQLMAELRFFCEADMPILHIPDWETLPYDHFSPHQEIISDRLEALYRLPEIKQGILLAPVTTLMQRLMPVSYINSHTFLLDKGQQLDIDTLREKLVQGGYRHVSQVMEHGEFSTRGSLLDLFPMGAKHPYRLDFFDDELDSIRTFNPEDQRSIEQIDQIRLLPAHEFPLDQDGISHFRQQFREQLDDNQSSIYRDVSNGMAPAGIEYYLPLFFEEMSTLHDYLPSKTHVLTLDGWQDGINQEWKQLQQRYENLRHDIERPLLPPEAIFTPPEETQTRLAPYHQIALQPYEWEQNDSEHNNFPSAHPGHFPVTPRTEHPMGLLKQFLAEEEKRVLFVAESAGRREALDEMLRSNQIKPAAVSSWQGFLSSTYRIAITVGQLDQGMQLPDAQLAIVTEPQLLGEKVRQTRRRKRATRDSDAVIANLTDLNIGAPVVHVDHGVGRYQGLTTLDIGGIETEFLTLHYAGEDKLYVPVASLHLIGRYTGAAEDTAPLHKLGGEQWQKLKRKAAEQARDVAAELLEIHARRAARKGHAFAESSNYDQFASTFAFEETPDQQKAIDQVIADMRNPQPMDRVVCGDVGFGKTEVAMRAAFAAVDGGKQVAVLVPTTLLAQQHYQNFVDRFVDWPINIASLSRFGTKKEQDEVLKSLKNGQVDVVIGTHKLLQKSIKFDNLGLIIVDEEHRFGVRHKEQLKALRSEVDILTLTATPIPRTLNMSLAGLRDLSIIATPPAHRHAIKTFVNQWNDELIREACQRELARGGQVYFLHNEVSTMERICRQLEEIMPEAKIRHAHGQMRETELETTMSDFAHQRFNILVCTTIVESGIDIPNANTILINRADKLGLAQLHQLRGRVGRSHHRAYAYLIAPPKSQMTSDAEKRLSAIESLEDLGVGFTLATHDLEIRGAGELLGEGQSGQIQAIGFSLYSELLDRAVEALKAGKIPDHDQSLAEATEVELHLPALLPADYVHDVHHRLIAYKRIASAKTKADLKELQVELIDRFGLLPPQTKTLFMATELKLRCAPVGIKRLEANAGGGRLVFDAQPNIDLGMLIQLVQQAPNVYRFDGQDVLRFSAELQEPEQRLQFINTLLSKIAVPEAAE